MRSVDLKTLKNKLSEYIRLAAGGETVLVTDRDRVVAEIGPPGPARSLDAIGCTFVGRPPARMDDAADLGRAGSARA